VTLTEEQVSCMITKAEEVGRYLAPAGDPTGEWDFGDISIFVEVATARGVAIS
jgi:hypothetical protein